MRTNWEEDSEWHSYMFLLVEDTCIVATEDNFKRHLLLEFLAYLNILEYHRGYDGCFYDIGVKKTRYSV